mgnify:FL=1
MVYLDYAASTPVDKRVLDKYYSTMLECFANPNSSHRLGLLAKEKIDKASLKIAKYFHIKPTEIIYTSGSSEANNLAIKGIAKRYKSYGKHILISSLEHNSIIASATSLQEEGFEIELIPVNNKGYIDIDILKEMIREDTILVSVTSVDSEIGLRQPIEEIAKIIKEKKHCFFHTDASQSIGKVDIDYKDVDLVTVAPHKFYGQLGIGLLIRKENVGLKPQIDGGKSTTIYRAGTPDVAGIVAVSEAIEIALSNLDNRYKYIKNISEIIKEKLKKYDGVVINNTINSIPYTINFSLKGVKAQQVAKLFSDHEIYVSAKTSCCPVTTPSKLVYALTHDKSLATSSIRVSLSHLTTMDEVLEFLKVFDIIYKECCSNGKI